MLKVENLHYSYQSGEYAVKDVSFGVTAGEFVAIAGRNGSGKTTLTRLIMALLKPAGGRILLDGAPAEGLSTADMARHIGYVFQNPDRQIFRDTVAAEVAYGPEQLGFDGGRAAAAAEQAIAAAGLSSLAAAYPRTLSKGQKQRVAIASALAMRPRMLILDEPTSGQDASEKLRLMELLARLNADGMSIILITHDMELLSRFARRTIVLDAGVKVFDGPSAQLFAGRQDVREWGLRAPAAVQIAQGLGARGFAAAVISAELRTGFTLTGGEQHA